LNFEKVWQLFQETDRKFQETDCKFQDTDRILRETDKKMKALQDLFEGQWGKLMESLVEGDLVHLLGKRGIQVRDTSTRRKGCRNGENYEFDIISARWRGDRHRRGQDDPAGRLGRQVHRTPPSSQVLPARVQHPYKVLGAVAYLRAEQSSDQYAQNQGLFVIRATGDSAAIVNPTGFQPRQFR